MLSVSNISKNLIKIENNIIKSLSDTGKQIEDINIVAVTKSFPQPVWELALENKLSIIGESKVQEVEKKNNTSIRKKIQLHLIGHLQTNKIKKAIKHFDVIQTVDSIKLAEKINLISEKENKQQQVFFQINIGKDPNKFGFNEQNIIRAAELSATFKNLVLKGIMTIPPNNLSDKKLGELYKKTRRIKEKISDQINKDCQYLSMGMSNDYEIAIKEGSTHIRVGTALFGQRPTKC